MVKSGDALSSIHMIALAKGVLNTIAALNKNRIQNSTKVTHKLGVLCESAWCSSRRSVLCAMKVANIYSRAIPSSSSL